MGIYDMFKLLLIVSVLLVACASNHLKPEENSPLSQNYTVESLSVVQKNSDEKTAIFLIKGVLPSPAYSVKEIKIDYKDNFVTFLPVIIHDPNKIVIQMAIPFEKEIKVKNIKNACDVKVGEKTYIKKFSIK